MELGVEGERVHSWRCEGEESALVEVWRRECTHGGVDRGGESALVKVNDKE